MPVSTPRGGIIAQSSTAMDEVDRPERSKIDGWSAKVPADQPGRTFRQVQRPPPGDQVAVPAQQRGRRDEERRPPHPREQPRQSGQHSSVRRFQVQPAYLAAQYRDLMPQHEYL